MKYVITLDHNDFTLYLEVLKQAQKQGITAWSAAEDLCKHTEVVP